MMKQQRVCITGGSGFLGTHLVREITDKDSPISVSEIVVYDLAPPPVAIAGRVRHVSGDIRDRTALGRALEGVDIVFHMAAIVDWGTRSPTEVRGVNVEGTEAVVEAARHAGVKVLILTSSLDATFSGREQVDVDESLSYPARHPNMYCRSKMEAELVVNAAHGDDLQTCSLRPADIYGPADPYHMPPLIEMAENGFYVRIGDGSALSQHCYVGNVAVAHLQAARAFLDGRNDHGGRSYFITDGPPANFFTFFDRMVSEAGYTIRPRNLRIPFALFYAMGALVELVTLPVRPVLKRAPRVSRFAAVYTCTTYTFRADRAAADFGFTPKYDEESAVAETIAYYRRGKPVSATAIGGSSRGGRAR